MLTFLLPDFIFNVLCLSFPVISPERRGWKPFLIIQVDIVGVIGPGIADRYRLRYGITEHHYFISLYKSFGKMELLVSTGNFKTIDISIFVSYIKSGCSIGKQ